MTTLKKIAVVCEEFALGAPAQQILDRFLLGYPRDGEFHRLESCQICVYSSDTEQNLELERRTKEHGLVRADTLGNALNGADGVLLIPHGIGRTLNDGLIRGVLESAPLGSSCFVHGILGSSLAAAKSSVALARSRQIRLLAGTSVSVTWRLPEFEVPRGAPIREGLIVVQGDAPVAELEALDGILPWLERRPDGETGVGAVRYFAGEDVWEAGQAGVWSWPLLAAALSRSDSPQGDPAKDGRTQDLVGLGLVPKLAHEPRGWLIEHRDGLRSVLLVLSGVVADYNCALALQDGSVLSAQLYRPPKPAQHQFSRLVAFLEDFIRGADVPWPVERSLLTAGLLEKFRTRPLSSKQKLETPEL